MSNPIRIKLLGHEFVAMTAAHFEGLAGAPAGSYIYEGSDGTILVASPSGTRSDGAVLWDVNEIDTDGIETLWTARRMA